MKKPSLLSQVLAINAMLVFLAVLAASVAAGFNLSVTDERDQFAVLVAAILSTVLVNGFLLRRRFQPLERLIETMEQVDVAAGSLRAVSSADDSVEVSRLNQAFNMMLDRLERERRRAGQAVLRAQEDERQRIAQDLHDEVNQALTAILLRVEATLQSAPPELRRELLETKQLANQAMEELLQLARQLRPTALDDHGLIPALHTQVTDFSERTGIDAVFNRRGHMPRLSKEQQLVIYRVAQESLSNVAQHSGAKKVDVELSFVGRTILRVRDDGVGFTNGRPGGLGLSGMKERALLVGAQLEIRSAGGRGTTVELIVP